MNLSTFNKPIIDAAINVIIEMGLVPHITLLEDHKDVVAPAGYSKDGVLTLNVSPQAAKNYHAGETCITYSGSFGGKMQSVSIPYDSIGAVYPREHPYVTCSVPALATPVPEEIPEETEVKPNPKANRDWAKSATVH